MLGLLRRSASRRASGDGTRNGKRRGTIINRPVSCQRQQVDHSHVDVSLAHDIFLLAEHPKYVRSKKTPVVARRPYLDVM